MKRHPAAIARDQYFCGACGRTSLNLSTFPEKGHLKYLQNRLHLAFAAGYQAAVDNATNGMNKHVEEVRSDQG